MAGADVMNALDPTVAEFRERHVVNGCPGGVSGGCGRHGVQGRGPAEKHSDPLSRIYKGTRLPRLPFPA